MTTTATISKDRLQKIVNRLQEYSGELEDSASELENGTTCDALVEAVRRLDQAWRVLEKLMRVV